jgi:DNA-binding response OmpR family regulator
MIGTECKILVVEDEPKVGGFIYQGLLENGYGVTLVSDAETALSHDIPREFSIAIVDINLPGVSGYELARIIRKNAPRFPILILSAMSALEDKIEGFNSGADDYLVKPFDFLELLARLQALLRRSEQTPAGQPEVLRIADLEINLESFEVTRGNIKIPLTQKEFQLLAYLMHNAGKVLKRSQIAKDVWDISFDTGTNVIDVYINFLRKKIDRGFEPKLIQTQTGVGYFIKPE